MQIPANCIVLAVGVRVITTITGPTSYEIGISGNLVAVRIRAQSPGRL